MKLLYCAKCKDVFKLDLKMRHCKCGRVKGRYLGHRNAEVSASAISIAIGNGSFKKAMKRMKSQEKNNPKSDRAKYKEISNMLAWVRPNFGPGNPHTQLIGKKQS